MWLILAFLSAAMLGCYDSFKKQALKANAVIPVLFLNTLFSSLIFLPFIVLSATTDILQGTIFQTASGGWEMHKYIVLKALIVLSSWILGYFGMKHLPLTIVGPINATIYMIVGAAMLGAISGLYDKYLMAPVESGGVGLDRMMVQSWYNIYQCGMMALMLWLLWWPKHQETTPFHWSWSILGVSIFLSTADFMYFYSLSLPDAMISIVSMIRRGSVIVSFLFGALFFREKNLKAKAFDLALVLLGMLFLYIGSK